MKKIKINLDCVLGPDFDVWLSSCIDDFINSSDCSLVSYHHRGMDWILTLSWVDQNH